MLRTYDQQAIKVEKYELNTPVTINSGAFANATGEVTGQQGSILMIQLDSLRVVLKVDLTKTTVNPTLALPCEGGN